MTKEIFLQWHAQFISLSEHAKIFKRAFCSFIFFIFKAHYAINIILLTFYNHMVNKSMLSLPNDIKIFLLKCDAVMCCIGCEWTS